MKKSRKVENKKPFTEVLPPVLDTSIEILPDEDFKLDSIKTMKIGISLNEYLSKHFSQRVLDNVLRKWYIRKDPTNPKKTVEEWDKEIESFNNQTER